MKWDDLDGGNAAHDDVRDETAAYLRWRQARIDDTPVEYRHWLDTSWAAFVADVNATDDKEASDDHA